MTRRSNHRWTTQDEQLIKLHYSELGAQTLADRIGTTAGSVHQRASQLGVTGPAVRPTRIQKHEEDAEQAALFAWAALQPISGADIERGSHIADYLYAIPNGGYRRALEAQRLTRLGVKAGVSDLHLPLARLGYLGFWIEMKRQLSSFPGMSIAAVATSQKQMRWLERMQKAGYAACTCFGWAEASQLITKYINTDSGFSAEYYKLMIRFKDHEVAA